MNKTCHGVTIQLPDRSNDEVGRTPFRVLPLWNPGRETPALLHADCKVWASTLERETCSHCKQPNCCYTCDGSVATLQDVRSKTIGDVQDVAGRLQFNGALDGIESLILSAAVAGIDIESPAFMEAVETAIDAIGNNA